jgi:gamma-glutamyl-gamma-aminobutyrate hydrolase PuuD
MLENNQRRQLAEAEEQLIARIAAALEEQRPTDSAKQSGRERPRIGIFAGKGTIREGAWQVYGGDLYAIDAIADAGGYPQILPTFPVASGLDPFDLLTDYDAFRFIFDTIWPVVRDLDGLVLTGGSDLDSRFFYCKVPHPRLLPADLWRDAWEWFATLLSYATFKTTFGICRGLQVMNVVLGGSLFQDHEELRRAMGKRMPPLLTHRQGRPIFKNFIGHPLIIVQNSWLAQAVRGEVPHAPLRYYLDDVLSQHHNFIGVLLDPASMEVIGDLADGLVISAYSPDRVIEAIASKDPRRIYVAVQFHPEYVRTLAWANCIFRYIVAGARRDAAIDRSVFEPFREELLAWLWLRAKTLHELKSASADAELSGSEGPMNGGRSTDALTKERTLTAVGS